MISTQAFSAEPKLAAKGLKAYPIIGVLNGDTIKVRIGKQVETVRIIGGNMPETKHPSEPLKRFGKANPLPALNVSILSQAERKPSPSRDYISSSEPLRLGRFIRLGTNDTNSSARANSPLVLYKSLA